jgi:methionine-R-sulfoxide reductase
MKTYNKNPEAVSLLTPEQYRVTQQDGTERPLQNEYWDNNEPGLYVDVVSGEPLFASVDKFHSGTGWPSFTKPLEPANVVENVDRSHGKQGTSPLAAGDRSIPNQAYLPSAPIHPMGRASWSIACGHVASPRDAQWCTCG